MCVSAVSLLCIAVCVCLQVTLEFVVLVFLVAVAAMSLLCSVVSPVCVCSRAWSSWFLLFLLLHAAVVSLLCTAIRVLAGELGVRGRDDAGHPGGVSLQLLPSFAARAGDRDRSP